MSFQPKPYNQEQVARALANEMHLDAAASAFVLNDLVAKDSRLFNVEYAPLEAVQYLPINSNFHPGIPVVKYQQFDGAGVAQLSSDYATASPSNKITKAEFYMGVKTLRTSCVWSIDEIRAAAYEGTPLEQLEMDLARRSIQEGIDKLALNGDARVNMFGLLNIPNVPTSALAGGTEWDNPLATPDDIALSIVQFLQSIEINTKGSRRANALILDKALLNNLEARRMSSASDISIMEYVRRRFPGLQVFGSFLVGEKAVAYEKSPSVLELVMPIPFEVFPDDVKATRIVREMQARIGGVRAFFPKALAYKTNVLTAP